MRYLATWASGHLLAARTAVVLCYALINIAGISLGLMLPPDTRVAAWIILVAVLLSGAALVSYTGSRSISFNSRKLRSIVFCAATLLYVTGNTSLQLDRYAGMQASATELRAASLPRHTASHKHLSFRERLIRAKQWFSEQSNGVKALLIVATVLVTVLVICLWAAVCCGIVCEGLEALGYFLFFAGAAGAIFGCVRIIQRIFRGGPRKKSAS